jgi:hypothetical protein
MAKVLRKQMKRKIIITICILIVCIAFGVYSLVTAFQGPHISPESIVFTDPNQAVIDARHIIKSLGAENESDGYKIWKDELPESLNIPNLKAAFVFKDHLSLVVGHTPDRNVGARIWAEDSNRLHEDTPLKYKDIYFYKYCNDYEESPKNIKWFITPGTKVKQ